MPYNDLTSGEYLIKRVTDGNDQNTVNYISKETEDANHNSTNYVICPWTNSRTGVAYRHEKKSITDWESMTFSDFYKTKKADKSHGKDNDNEKATTPYNYKYYILDYVMENTSGSPVKVCGLGIDLHQSEEKELTINNTSELCSEMLDLCIEGFC